MNKKLLLTLLTAALLLALTACGGNGGGNTSSFTGGSSSNGMMAETMQPMEEAEMDFGAGSSGGAYPDAISNTENQIQESKMIHTASMDLETTDFDSSVSGLEQLVSSLGGYLEDSNLYTGGSSRWADYTVRVPADQFQPFLDQAGELCHLVRQTTGAENITEAYYDAQGRLRTQQIKLERLQNLLAQAENMEDIITLESAISETEYNIDSLSGTLRHYDALVNFATIHISLSEVYRLSAVEEIPDSFASRLGTAFTSGLSSFGEWLENLAVGLAYSWIWLLLLAAAAYGVFRFVRWQRNRAFPPGNTKQDPPPKR